MTCAAEAPPLPVRLRPDLPLSGAAGRKRRHLPWWHELRSTRVDGDARADQYRLPADGTHRSPRAR